MNKKETYHSPLLLQLHFPKEAQRNVIPTVHLAYNQKNFEFEAPYGIMSRRLVAQKFSNSLRMFFHYTSANYDDVHRLSEMLQKDVEANRVLYAPIENVTSTTTSLEEATERCQKNRGKVQYQVIPSRTFSTMFEAYCRAAHKIQPCKSTSVFYSSSRDSSRTSRHRCLSNYLIRLLQE